MNARKPAELFSFLLYMPVALIFVCLSQVFDQAEPIGLAFLFALSASGLNPFLCGLCYVLSSLPHWALATSGIYLLQAVLLAAGFFLSALWKNPRRSLTKQAKFPVLPFLCFLLGLAAFFLLAPFSSYPLPFSLPALSHPSIQKLLFCGFIILLSAVFTVSTQALLHKFLKCRLRVEEILFSAVLYLTAGVGFCRFFSLNAYLGVAFFSLLLFCYVTKDASGVLFSFLLSLPSFLTARQGIAEFFLLAVALVLFSQTGKWGLVFALLCVRGTTLYLDGALAPSSPVFLPSLLSTLIPCVLFLLTPNGLVRKLENELIFYREKHLSRIAVNLGRAAVGGQLFELSTLFKEIETTFLSLSDDSAEKNACAFLVNTVWQEHCRACSRYKSCQARGIKGELAKLIEIGCMKGRVSLIDMTDGLAKGCDNQSDLLYAVNRQLTDFRRFMTEAENAASGRALLASQAQGVSEILKNVALEQSQPLQIHTKKEKALSVAFLKAGVVCTEIMLYGQEEDVTLSLITYGKTDVKKIAAVAKSVLAQNLIISKKIHLSRDKCCFILRKKPIFDAAFGVATRTKLGENACGDTYSVVKIDEKRFMVALADGMGSGQYAQKISSCTLSLLESFYRAKMPPPLILSTVNRLLNFGQEESFTCVDIGIVDLDSGSLDVVKIGTPSAFILSEKSMQILESASLPLGILDSLRPSCASYTLKENEVLLFVSDGVSGAFGGANNLCELIKSAPIANPQLLCDYLLDEALSRYEGIAKDDMTVVAVRLFKPAA